MDEFIDPTTLTPLFTAQQTVCTYPVSDFYAGSPRYLYYALLVACFVTQWKGWLANVFLGGAAAYAGVAAIEAIILRSYTVRPRESGIVSIPYVSTPLNSTFQSLKALVTNQNELTVQPAALELDIDPILAIVVTGYLVVLPMQCWSKVVKANRARHLLITIWNALMLAGTVCALTLWPDLYYQPAQYRFCYPSYPDPPVINNDQWPSQVWQGSWNTSIWDLFTNLTASEQLSDNCFYPCFNTSQILRKSTSLTASDYDPTNTPRLNLIDLAHRSKWISILPNLIYLAIALNGAALIFLVIVSRLRNLSRIPIGEPQLLWRQRRELSQTLWNEFRNGFNTIYNAITSPRRTYKNTSTSRATTNSKIKILKSLLNPIRFHLDILTLLVLLLSMILSPLTIVAFVVWIEWYIRHDGHSGEGIQQVGQWSTYVSVALVLVSALIYRLKYVVASREEIGLEILEVKEHLRRLEGLVEKIDRDRDRDESGRKKKKRTREGRGEAYV